MELEGGNQMLVNITGEGEGHNGIGTAMQGKKKMQGGVGICKQ